MVPTLYVGNKSVVAQTSKLLVARSQSKKLSIYLTLICFITKSYILILQKNLNYVIIVLIKLRKVMIIPC